MPPSLAQGEPKKETSLSLGNRKAAEAMSSFSVYLNYITEIAIKTFCS